ncbi:MAG: hypothetical protein ABEN55_06740 [Bradymonadaceae bacterium]
MTAQATIPDLEEPEQPVDDIGGFPQPGIHPDVPEEEYHAADDLMSSTQLRALDTSVRTWLHKREETVEGDAIDLGDLIHKYVLEPDKFEKERAVLLPERPVEGKSWKPKHAELARMIARGRSMDYVLEHHSSGYTEDTYRGYLDLDGWNDLVAHFQHDRDRPIEPPDRQIFEQAEATGEFLLSQPRIRGGLLDDGEAELTVVWDCQPYGVPSRARPDFIRQLPSGELEVVELKTTSRSIGYWWRRTFYQRRYHMQPAFYAKGIEAAFGEPVARYYVIGVEIEEPRHADIRWFDRGTLLEDYGEDGERIDIWHTRCRPALARYVDYRDGELSWLGRDPDITEEEPPHWAL